MISLLLLVSYLYLLFFTTSSGKELHAYSHHRHECNYGIEPGSWKGGDDGDRWEMSSSRCSLTNFLLKFTNSYSPFPVRMLFLGDSLDRNTMEDTCFFYDKLNHHDSGPKNFNSSYNCSYGNISMMFRYIPGVSIDGPFFQADQGNPPGQESSFIGRSIESKNMFFDLYQDHPNIVVLSSNFWDLARLVTVDNYQQGEYLPRSILESYQKNLTQWIHLIKELYSSTSTVIVFHSHARPCYDLNTGRLIYGAFGPLTLRSWQQINAQSKFVSIQEHLRFVDLEAMSVTVPQRTLLRPNDVLHPQQWFNLDVFNIYLNHLAGHLRYNSTD